MLNAVQWLFPKARDRGYQEKLFEAILGPVYTLDQVRDGAEQPTIEAVFRFVQKRIAADFDACLERAPFASGELLFDRPDQAIEAKFAAGGDGVCLFGFEGFDSHWTVARGVTTDEVVLFDSWDYQTFDRRQFVWTARAKDINTSARIVVLPSDLNWISIGRAPKGGVKTALGRRTSGGP